MSAITAKASRKMKKYAVLTREPRCFLGSFDFSWEQRKLGEVSESYSGGTPSVGVKEYYGGKIPFIRSAEINSEITELFLTEEGLKNSSARLVGVGDILYALYGATSGEVGRARLKGAINQAILAIKPHTGYDSGYLAQWLRKSKHSIIETYLQGGQGNLSGTIVKELSVDFPLLKEQQAIGDFFSRLDNLITLHQRKCALLFSPFQALISMMFTTSTFSWEQRKAKELFVSTADKGYPELPVLSATQDRGMIRRDENSINIFHDKKNEAGYKRVLPGQFVIHLRSFQGGFAHSAIEGITSPAYTVFGFSEPVKHDSEYWKYVFTSKSFIRRLETVTYGIRDGRSISYEEFLTLGFVYPSKAEQTAIARYLDKLSDLITLHQRECISFTGRAGSLILTANKKRTTSSWEQRKFSDITFLAGEKNRDNLPLESYSITNEHGFVPQDEKFENGGTMREADKRMYYIVSPNSFAYNPARINVGSIGYQNVGKNVIVSSLYEVFKTSEDVDDRLLWHWFKSPDFQKLIMQLQEGGVRLYFYYDKLCMGEVSLPSLEEQRKIGKLFDTLDNLITLHQRKPFLMKWRTSDANRNQTNRLVL